MSSDGAQSNSVRRRPRPILSCLGCRRKKLGCDRRRPCNQCVKIEKPQDCAYETPPETRSSIQPGQDVREHNGNEAHKRQRLSPSPLTLEGGAAFAPTAGPSLGVVEDLQQRILRLERIVSQQQNGESRSKDTNILEPAAAQDSGYYGPKYAPNTKGHRMYLFEPFTEAKTFLWSIPEDPGLKPYVHRLKKLVKGCSQGNSQPAAASSAGLDHTSTSILPLIPAKAECDEHVRAYFANSEKTLRVLHKPSFLEVYDNFWNEDGALGSTAPFGFVPQLAIVVAASSNTDRLYGTRLNVPPLQQKTSKTALCAVVQTWLDSLKRAERMEFHALQTQAILVLCQHNIFLPNDLSWQATGSLVRRAMLINLHRDPGNSKEFTPLEIEMRRRLWASIVEMDLQTSLVWGMPSAICESNFSSLPPSNLDDSDLLLDTYEAPAQKSSDTWTDTLLQVVLARSLRTRLRIASFLNDLRQEMAYDKRQRLGMELEEVISSIPTAAKPETYEHDIEDASDRHGRLLGRVLLDISVRRMLLYLYRPFAMNVSSTEIFYRARRICRDSALAILSHQDAFLPKHTGFEVADALECWALFDTACRHDLLLAALTICWEIRMLNSARSKDSRDRSGAEGRGANSWTKVQLTRVVEEAVASLLQNIDLPGGFLKDLVGLSVILECVKTQGPPETREHCMRAAVEKILTNIVSKLETERSSRAQSSQSYRGSTTSTPADMISEMSDPATFGSFDLDFLPPESLQNWDMDTLFSVWHTTA